MAPWYSEVAGEWFSGALIAVGIGCVLAIVTRRWAPDVAPLAHCVAALVRAPTRVGWGLGLASFVLYATVAQLVFSGVPLHLDEVAQVIQARIFASGRLYLETGAHPEFRSALHILDDNGRWYSQFPPGGPLLLVPGVWTGATWAVGPALGAGCVALFWSVIRRIERRPAVSLGASLVFALAPLMVFMSGSHMNHVGALFWMLAATYAFVRVDDHFRFAGLLGFAFGMLAAIRPVDALAFALPAGTWLGWRTVRNPSSWRALVSAGFGIAAPLMGLLWYNWRTTGDATLFAYELLWGPGHGLGFHAAPWGDPHTPARGLELISLYGLRLQTYLFETPLPSLAFAIVGLAIPASLHRVDRYWLVSSLVLLLAYFTYWHDGFYLGPRFVFLLLPLLVVWSVRGPVYLAERLGGGVGSRAVWWSVATCVAMAAVINVPGRVAQYARGLKIMRHDPTEPAKRAGVHNALIFVRESWGAQLVPRLWALGIPRPLTEAAYRSTDTCVLDGAITRLEERAVHGNAAVAQLLPVLRDSARLERSPWSPDASERMLAGQAYGAACQRRILEDRAGFTIFLPVLARDWRDNLYARDLHARDSLLMRQHPSRALYLLRTDGPLPGAPLVLVPLARDSMLAEWALRQ